MSRPLCMDCINGECQFMGRDVRMLICYSEFVPSNGYRVRNMDNADLAAFMVESALRPGKTEEEWLEWLNTSSN